MKKTLLSIFLIVAVGLVVLSGLPVFASPGAALAQSPLQTATLTNTLRPSASSTPTVDILYQAQATQAQLGVELAQAKNTADIAKVTTEAIRTDTALTETRATREAGDRATATTAATQTLIAVAIQTQSAANTATVQAPITRRLGTQADWEPAWQMTKWAIALTLTLAVIFIGFALADEKVKQIREQRKYFREQVTVASAPTPAPRKLEAATVNVKIDTRDKYGWGAVDFHTLPIDDETLTKVSELITSGARYTEKQMTGSGKPLVKGGSFDSFGKWMTLNKIAVETDDGRYVIQHDEFFEQVLSQ